MAAGYLRHARHSLQPTQIVHDAYVRLQGRAPGGVGRGELFGLVAHVMRNVLIDHVRAKKRLRNGGGRVRLDLEGLEPSTADEGVELVALDGALNRLEVRGVKYVRILEARIFGGATMDQIAGQLGVSLPIARRELRLAVAYLRSELRGEMPPGGRG